MTELIARTVNDLHAGRTSWRVMLLLVLPALITGISAGLIPTR